MPKYTIVGRTGVQTADKKRHVPGDVIDVTAKEGDHLVDLGLAVKGDQSENDDD